MPGEARVPRSLGGPRAFVRRYIRGDTVARVLVTASAALILVVTISLVYELWINSHLSREKFGCHFLVTKVWDPNAAEFGALAFVFGTCVTSFLALFIAVPLGVGSRDLPLGARAAEALERADVLHRAAGGGAERDLRTAWRVRDDADDQAVSRARLLKGRARLDADFSGPVLRTEHARGGNRARGDDPAVHRVRVAAGAPRGAERPARRRARARRDEVGVDVEGRRSATRSAASIGSVFLALRGRSARRWR